MRKMNFWDILAWIILALIIVWITLKVFRVISTPLWLEYAPIYGAVYLTGWAMHKLYTATDEIKELKRFRNDTIKEINNIKSNCLKNHPPKK